jgi:hypothetical protein
MALQFDLDRFQARAFRMCQPGTIATFPWGRGSGKTFVGGAIIHSRALSAPGRHIGLLMPSLKQARQVFWPKLFADFEGPLRSRIRGKANKTSLEVTYENGSRLTTWGAENAGGIRGQRFTDLIEDETDDIDPEVEQAVVRPTFSRSGVNALWVKFGTPRRGRAGSLWFSYQKALNGAAGYAGFSLTSRQSPQVDQRWLDGVQADTPPDIYAREYEVNFDAAGGRVWGDVFREKFHVRAASRDSQWNEIFVCADHGWEEPGCFLLVGVKGSGRDASGHVLDEIYERHRTEDWWRERLREWLSWYPRMKMFGDPSQPARLEAYRRDGARVQEVDNSIFDGIDAVSDKFLIRHRRDDEGNVIEGSEYARLYVAPHCVNLLTELGCTPGVVDGRKALDGVGPYMRKSDPEVELRYLEEVVDKNNHASDALRYGIFNYFGGPDRRRAGSPHEALG